MVAGFAILTLMHSPCFAIHSLVQNYAKIIEGMMMLITIKMMLTMIIDILIDCRVAEVGRLSGSAK